MLRIPKSECPDGYVFHHVNGPNHGQTLKIQWFLLNEIMHGHPLAGHLWGRQFDEDLTELGWEKAPKWWCLFVHRKHGLLSSVYKHDTKMAGKKQTMAPMWKKLMKER